MKRKENSYYSSNSNYSGRAGSGSSSVLNSFKEAEKISSNIFKLFDKGAGSILSAFSTAFGFVQQMILLMQSVQNTSSIFSSIFSLIPGGGLIDTMMGKAGGGSVLNSIPYIVGERGPEIFIPDVNGSIIPSDIASSYFTSLKDVNAMQDNLSGAGNKNNNPNITVIVQSEVEASKAVRFFSNHFPDYENRRGKENF
jgi:hypothetical protein